MTTLQAAPFAQYTDQLRSMAECLRKVARTKPSMTIDELLSEAAEDYGTTAAQMKYALSFARVKKLVEIDYDSATVTAIAPATGG